MAKVYHVYVWKKAPFLRLMIPLIAGIILEFYFNFSVNYIIVSGIILLIAFSSLIVLPEVYRFKFKSLQGIIIYLFMIVFGLFITWQNDIRNNKNWYGNQYFDSSFIVATIAEPPVEKAKSFKALASVESTINNETVHKIKGNLLLYFAKDSGQKELQYGDRIIIGKKLQQIKNSGNPGAFDYAQYSAFHQLYHQCYLKRNEWILLKEKNKNAYSSFIFSTRETVVKIIEKYITGNDESSIAKALLIGYKVDLDKDLVQAYSNAGVVHLIAISGLHMGIIYGVLLWLFSNIPIIKKSKITRLILILACLWLFALLTGASPSVLRAAVMFSFIVTGSAIDKHGSVYNSLAASAFLLLCFNPFILWDVGFQLSYLAVLGIVIAHRSISDWFYFENKIIQHIWQLAAVSLAAQLFTFPVCLYYFHQLPLLFLLANIFAIPLATLILWGCLILVFISPLQIVALYFGKLLFGLLWLLNHSVLLINSVPFSLWERVSISATGTLFLYAITCSIIYFMLYKNSKALQLTITFSLFFAGLTAIDKWEKYNQKKIIVYNIPSHAAIDFISGNNFRFVGDSGLLNNNMLRNFHLKPTRISLNANNTLDSHYALFQQNNFYKFYKKKILIIDTGLVYHPLAEKIKVDYIIISKNPKLNISSLIQTFDCNYYVFDASNSLWKIDKWKKECEELHLHSHSVSEQGAFVTNL